MFPTGTVEPFQLLDLARALRDERFTGFLDITKEDEHVQLSFHRGEIVFARSEDIRRSFPAFLLKNKLVEREDMRAALNTSKTEQTPLNQVLVDMNLINPKELQQAMTDVCRYLLAYAFSLSPGAYCLTPAEDPPTPLPTLNVQIENGLFQYIAGRDDASELSSAIRDHFDRTVILTELYATLAPMLLREFHGKEGDPILDSIKENQSSISHLIATGHGSNDIVKRVFAMLLAGMVRFERSSDQANPWDLILEEISQISEATPSTFVPVSETPPAEEAPAPAEPMVDAEETDESPPEGETPPLGEYPPYALSPGEDTLVVSVEEEEEEEEEDDTTDTFPEEWKEQLSLCCAKRTPPATDAINALVSAAEKGSQGGIDGALLEALEKFQTTSIYSTLGVPPDAPLPDIKEKCRALRNKYDPQNYASFMLSKEAEHAITVIGEHIRAAWTILSDIDKRKALHKYGFIPSRDEAMRVKLDDIAKATELSQQAAKALGDDEYQKAADLMEEAVGLVPHDATLHANFAWTCFQGVSKEMLDTKKYKSVATKSLKEGNKLNPKSEQLLRVQARIARLEGRNRDATEAYQKLLSVNTRDEEARQAVKLLRSETETNTESVDGNDAGVMGRVTGMFKKR